MYLSIDEDESSPTSSSSSSSDNAVDSTWVMDENERTMREKWERRKKRRAERERRRKEREERNKEKQQTMDGGNVKEEEKERSRTDSKNGIRGRIAKQRSEIESGSEFYSSGSGWEMDEFDERDIREKSLLNIIPSLSNSSPLGAPRFLLKEENTKAGGTLLVIAPNEKTKRRKTHWRRSTRYESSDHVSREKKGKEEDKKGKARESKSRKGDESRKVRERESSIESSVKLHSEKEKKETTKWNSRRYEERRDTKGRLFSSSEEDREIKKSRDKDSNQHDIIKDKPSVRDIDTTGRPSSPVKLKFEERDRDDKTEREKEKEKKLKTKKKPDSLPRSRDERFKEKNTTEETQHAPSKGKKTLVLSLNDLSDVLFSFDHQTIMRTEGNRRMAQFCGGLNQQICDLLLLTNPLFLNPILCEGERKIKQTRVMIMRPQTVWITLHQRRILP